MAEVDTNLGHPKGFFRCYLLYWDYLPQLLRHNPPITSFLRCFLALIVSLEGDAIIPVCVCEAPYHLI